MPQTDHGQGLFRVVYASRAVLPVLAAFDQTVGDILALARPNNQRLGLTGMLLAHKGWFLQTLEGPRRNVSQVFGSIGRDLRHAQLELLSGVPVDERLFGQWEMCARGLTPAAQPVLAQLDLTPDFDPFILSGDRALRLLTAIAAAPAPAVRAL